MGGTIDVHAHMKIHAWGEGQLQTDSVVNVVGVVRLQDGQLIYKDAWSDQSIKETPLAT